MSEVYLVRDLELRQVVALKVLRHAEPDRLLAEENGAKLQQELALNYPQIPKVYDIKCDANPPFIVMEYVEGQSLAQLMEEEGAFAEHRAVAIAIQLCDVLGILHRYTSEIAGKRFRSIVHADIKPENIYIINGGQVRVLDFGIAKPISVSRSHTTNLWGSLPYLPPERLVDRGHLDHLSDLWAIGVLLYSLVSGRSPFPGSTPAEVEQRLMEGRLGTLPTSCSPALRSVIQKSLSRDPQLRYPNAPALRQALADIDSSATRRTAHVPSTCPVPSARQPLSAKSLPLRSNPTRQSPTISSGPLPLLVRSPLPSPSLPLPTRGRLKRFTLVALSLCVLAVAVLAVSSAIELRARARLKVALLSDLRIAELWDQSNIIAKIKEESQSRSPVLDDDSNHPPNALEESTMSIDFRTLSERLGLSQADVSRAELNLKAETFVEEFLVERWDQSQEGARYLSAEVQQVAGSEKAGACLLFQGDQGFCLWHSGYALVAKNPSVDTRWSLRGGAKKSTRFLHSAPNIPNRLTLLSYEKKLIFFVNGTEVCRVSDSSPALWPVGFGILFEKPGRAEFDFYNYEIRK